MGIARIQQCSRYVVITRFPYTPESSHLTVRKNGVILASPTVASWQTQTLLPEG